MEPIIHADLDVKREVLQFIAAVAPVNEPCFMSISTSRGVTHIGMKGTSLSVFKTCTMDLCNVTLPDSYLVIVPVDDVRKWLSAPDHANEEYASLGDTAFCPKLQMKKTKATDKRKVKGKQHDEVVQQVLSD